MRSASTVFLPGAFVAVELSDAGQSVLGWIVAAAASLVLGYRKIRRLSSADKNAETSTDTQTSIMEMLRNEVARLSEQNTKLTIIVSSLQLEIIALRDENAALLRTIRGTRDGHSNRSAADQRG